MLLNFIISKSEVQLLKSLTYATGKGSYPNMSTEANSPHEMGHMREAAGHEGVGGQVCPLV